MNRRLPVDNGYAWGPDGRLWFFEQTDNTMRIVRFSQEPYLQVLSIDIAFGGLDSFWPERGFAIAPDGRLLIIRGAREASGLSGRLHVMVGWAREEGLAVGPGRP